MIVLVLGLVGYLAGGHWLATRPERAIRHPEPAATMSAVEVAAVRLPAPEQRGRTAIADRVVARLAAR